MDEKVWVVWKWMKLELILGIENVLLREIGEDLVGCSVSMIKCKNIEIEEEVYMELEIFKILDNGNKRMLMKAERFVWYIGVS